MRRWVGLCRAADPRHLATAVLAVFALALVQHHATYPLGSNFEWWSGLAADVLGGQAPYLDSPDNKPPLWAAVVIAAEFTGRFEIVMRALTAAASVATVAGCYAIARRRGVPPYASILVIVFAGLLLLAVSNPANNKPVGAALAVGALLLADRRPMAAGAVAGMAGTVAQQFGFILLVVGAYRYGAGLWSRTQGIDAAIGSATVVIGQYAAVGAIFGLPVLASSIDMTILSAVSYPAGSSPMPDGGVVGNKGVVELVARRGLFVLRFAPVFALAAVGAIADREMLAWLVASVPVLSMTVFSAYWVFVTPAIAITAGAGGGAVGSAVVAALPTEVNGRAADENR